MNKSNICGRCGGVISITSRGREYPGQMWTPDGWKPLCGCPPEQPKHDGNLDKDKYATVTTPHG
jgi:hypothetical protein